MSLILSIMSSFMPCVVLSVTLSFSSSHLLSYTVSQLLSVNSSVSAVFSSIILFFIFESHLLSHPLSLPNLSTHPSYPLDAYVVLLVISFFISYLIDLYHRSLLPLSDLTSDLSYSPSSNPSFHLLFFVSTPLLPYLSSYPSSSDNVSA